jgi:uncharacterized protein YndB with AHSA1/START domain
MRLEVETVINAPREAVWDVLTTWERQPEWMLDAKDVIVLTPQRTGDGVTLRCPTNLLGFTVNDIMRVTDWDPPKRLAVTHLGKIITGSGAFELSDTPDGGTHVLWWEEIDPPLGVVGELGARVLVLPIIRRIFTRSLKNFTTLCETDAALGAEE